MIRTLVLAAVATAVPLAPALAQGSCSEGCTPGFWATHPGAWDGVGDDDFTSTITTDLSYNAVFGLTPSESGLADSVTLLDATQTDGGGLQALARHAAAALASADTSICYPYLVGEVIDLVRDGVGAIPGPHDVESAKDALEAANELGCPLSNDYDDPDDFELFCVGEPGTCGCGNLSDIAGCTNSTGLGARLDAEGTGSVVADDLVLTATQLPANTAVLFLMAQTVQESTIGDGRLCIGDASKIIRIEPIAMSDAAGVATLGPGIVAIADAQPEPIAKIFPGDTIYFQAWYRDMLSPCGGVANITNAVEVGFY